MNDELKEIRFNIDRLLLQLIIPGISSVLAYFLIIVNDIPEIKKYLNDHESICITLLAVISIAAGLILENLGSLVEYYIYDRINANKIKDFGDIWDQYLRIEKFEGRRIVAHNYNKSIYLRMKFELSFGISLFFLSIGLAILNYKINLISEPWVAGVLIYVLPLSFGIYLLIEGHSSSKILHNNRLKLIEYERKLKNLNI